jgi:two-component system sensor histidine kinase TctE
MRWSFPRTPSLALRLSIAFALSILIVAAAYLSVQVVLVQRFASFITEQSLKGQTHDIAEAIDTGSPDGSVVVRLGGVEAYGFDAFFANLKYRVLTEDGQVVASSESRLDSLMPTIPVERQDGFYLPTLIDGVRFHVAAVRHSVDGRPFLVQVGRSDRFAELAQEAIVPAINEAVGVIVAISIVVLSLLSFLGIRSVLRPIRIASETAKTVGQANLSARLPAEDLPSEIRPLIAAFNDVLARLEVAFSSQQRFFANAAHELKTPLALLRGQLEHAEGAIPPAALRDVDSIARTVSQLLHIAEVSGGRSLDKRPTAVDEVARQVVGFLSWRAERAGVSLHIVCERAGVEVLSDQGELFVLLKNLVENAVDFSPEGGTVCVSVGVDRLAVEDQGRGVPEELREKVFERFWRGSQGDRPGSGLGLAICLEVATAHGWQIRCAEAASGGARFEVIFAVA